MTDSINLQRTRGSSVVPSLSWLPVTPYVYVAPNNIVANAPGASTNTAITFAASATILNQGTDLSGPLTITEYRWDFGDGVIAYGSGATHTYVVANLQARATLRITDSQGRQWFTYAQMYLQAIPPPNSGATNAMSLPLLLNRAGGGTASLPLLLSHT